MGKKNYEIIFIVLVYRNTKDLREFFKANNVFDSKTIVVNSFYDDETEAVFKQIALENNADFISVPNNGYGSGNNRGIEFALEHYSFDYIIVSNADICIEKFDVSILGIYQDCVIAPKILTLNGKNQNPSSPFSPSRFRERLVSWLYRNNHRHMIYVYYIWSRLSKIIFYLLSRFRNKIFSPHGAFFIIPYTVLKEIVPIYNERMFLFFEEHHFGQLAMKHGIKIVYVPKIVIRHKEDGSISFLSENVFSLMRQSYLEYYDYWFSSKHNVRKS